MKLDIFSNYAAKLLSTLLGFFLLPVYLHHLGVAAYGIIGFYGSLFSMMVLLDFGMGYASTKFIAESGLKNIDSTVRILKSVEVIYLAAAGLIGVTIASFAKKIATSWLTIDDPNIDGVTVVLLMSALMTVTWPRSLYRSFLAGQKRFVTKNILFAIVEVFKAGGILFFVVYRDEGLNHYFIVMIFLSIVEMMTLRSLAWKKLPKSKGFAKLQQLKPFFAYSSGISLMSIGSLIVFQAPIIFVSAFYPVSELGLINVAKKLPFMLFTLMYPISSVLFPRLVNIEGSKESKQAFVSGLNLITFISTSLFISGMLAIDSVFRLWLGDIEHLEVVIGLSKVFLTGSYLYVLKMIIGITLLANGKSIKVAFCYLAGIVALGFFLLFLGQKGVVVFSYHWPVVNAAITITMIMIFYREYQSFAALWSSIIGRFALFSLLAVVVVFGFDKITHLNDAARIVIAGTTVSICLFPPVYPYVKKEIRSFFKKK